MFSFELPHGITVFHNNVIILSWLEEPKAIHIKDLNLATQYLELFNKLYKSGEPYKPPKIL